MIILDKESFIMGVQVGRRLKAWDAARERPQQTRSIPENREEIPEEQEEAPDG